MKPDRESTKRISMSHRLSRRSHISSMTSLQWLTTLIEWANMVWTGTTSPTELSGRRKSWDDRRMPWQSATRCTHKCTENGKSMLSTRSRRSGGSIIRRSFINKTESRLQGRTKRCYRTSWSSTRNLRWMKGRWCMLMTMWLRHSGVLILRKSRGEPGRQRVH